MLEASWHSDIHFNPPYIRVPFSMMNLLLEVRWRTTLIPLESSAYVIGYSRFEAREHTWGKNNGMISKSMACTCVGHLTFCTYLHSTPLFRSHAFCLLSIISHTKMVPLPLYEGPSQFNPELHFLPQAFFCTSVFHALASPMITRFYSGAFFLHSSSPQHSSNCSSFLEMVFVGFH